MFICVSAFVSAVYLLGRIVLFTLPIEYSNFSILYPSNLQLTTPHAGKFSYPVKTLNWHHFTQSEIFSVEVENLVCKPEVPFFFFFIKVFSNTSWNEANSGGYFTSFDFSTSSRPELQRSQENVCTLGSSSIYGNRWPTGGYNGQSCAEHNPLRSGRSAELTD